MNTFVILRLNSCVMRNQNIEKYRLYLRAAGYSEVPNESEADNILTWTCSFREDVANNSIAKINTLSRLYPLKKIFICGCMPDILPDIFFNEGVILIPWKNEDKLFKNYFPPILASTQINLQDYDLIYSEAPVKKINPNFLDSFIKLHISEGCNEKCTYCTERLAFPPYRSFPIDELLKEVQKKISVNDNKIIAIFADSPGEYGCDTGKYNIITLLSELCKIDSHIKIVLHNMNPVFILKYSVEFYKLILNKIFYHINIPIQSASNRVLQVMGRRYSKDDLNKLFDFLSSCEFKRYDTHIIAGFPTESEDEFNETIDFLISKRPTYVLASPCMVPPGAPASKMSPKVSETEKRNRLIKMEKRLSSIGIIVNTPYNQLAKKRIDEINERSTQ